MSTHSLTTGEDCRLIWWEEGPKDAPVLVMLHPLGANAQVWDNQAAVLSSHFRVLRPDIRGHGVSDAPAGAYGLDRLGRDLLRILDAQAIESVDLCGLSMGGSIAQWMSVFAPNRVRRLVLANTAAWMGGPDLWDARIHTVTEEGTAAIADAVMSRWFTPKFTARAPEIVAGVREMVCATPADGYAGCAAALRDADLRPVVGDIRAPTLVIIGNQDSSTTPESGLWLASAIPGARHVELEAAHLSNVEQEQAFTAAVLDFLTAA